MEVKVADLRYVGSYNWVNKPMPTIIVPGSPREWINRAPPYQVHADDGFQFKDQNGFRCPNCVLLPLITAVNHMSTLSGDVFDWASMDFVTDRIVLRKLLRWINGSGNDFRIDIQVAGKTVLFNRWENCYKEQMSGLTFGFNFERESTKEAQGCEGSTGHHRIVQYDLNGLKLVVRFETDACIPVALPPASPSLPCKSPNDHDLENLTDALSSISLKTEEAALPPKIASTEQPTKFPTVTVVQGGTVVPQSSIVELTTRSIKNAQNFGGKETYLQLFLSQTAHHFLAIHTRGRFRDINKRKLESFELKDIALREIQDDLKKLRSLLDLIKSLSIKQGEKGRLSLVCRDGELRVYERTSQASCLPDEALQLFNI